MTWCVATSSAKRKAKQFVGEICLCHTRAFVDPFVDRAQDISDTITLEAAADDEITPSASLSFIY